MNRALVIGVCSVLLLTGVAVAGGPDASKVSAGAKWIAHMDVDALVATQFGQHILDEIELQGHAEAIADFTAVAGFDPTTDLSSITLWGETYEPDGGVAVLQGTFDQQKLIGLAVENEGHREAKYHSYTLQRWIQKPENAHDDGVRWGTFWADSVLLITRDQKVLETALDTLDNEAATMAAHPEASLDLSASDGAFLVVTAEDVKVPAKGAKRPGLVRELASAFFELGEADGIMFMNGRMTTLDEKDGEAFREMLEGMQAFAKMAVRHCENAGEEPPPWAPLADIITIGGEGAEVSINVEMSTEDVVGFMKEAKAKCEE